MSEKYGQSLLRLFAPDSRVLICDGRGTRIKAIQSERVCFTDSDEFRVTTVSTSFTDGGPWAGVSDIFQPIYEELAVTIPELVQKHATELVHVLPRLRRVVTVNNPNLTDLAPQGQKTRNYAADRAYRLVHGLVDLLDVWRTSRTTSTPWIIICESFDESGTINRKFFSELMRRRGTRLNLFLVASVRSTSEQIRAVFHAKLNPTIADTREFCGLLSSEQTATKVEVEADARELEAKVGDDGIEIQAHLPKLIALWTAIGDKHKILHWRFRAVDIYNNQGLYEDSLRYAECLLPLAKECAQDNTNMIWVLMAKIITNYLSLQRPEPALALAEGEAFHFARDHNPLWRAHLYYMLGTIYGRYLRPRSSQNLEKGTELLDAGLKELEHAGLGEGDYHFQYVFNRNGLAMIRNFQGRHEDALRLCEEGIARLQFHLDRSTHRLHRSVLLYNIAQVYAATKNYDRAIEYYTSAMEMDPNYSEYYNDRAGLFLKLDRLEEAERDYLRAIELSPPYFEVFTNLGQCYRKMGRFDQAVDAYTRAIDLEPLQPLAFLGRGNASDEMGLLAEAEADYTAALELDPEMWDAYASRGVLFYQRGDLEASLSDFTNAILRRPDNSDLYRNRGLLFSAMSRYADAREDFGQALRLGASDEDANLVREQLRIIDSVTLQA